MNRTWSKICGITRVSDAEAAVRYGVSAIGLILTESPRRVVPEQAFGIRNSLSESIDCVGVFTDESVDEILDLAQVLKLDKVQLHGEALVERIEAIKQFYPVIQAIRVLPDGSFNRSSMELPADYILLDTAIKGMSGGTGVHFNWNVLAELDSSRLIVAGGVGPDNVDQLIRDYQPYGVDASSQLELSPGIKDIDRIRRYLQAIQTADNDRMEGSHENIQ